MPDVDRSKELTVLSLCAGYGGLELGLARALANPLRVVAVEIEAFALANLEAKAAQGALAIDALWPDLRSFPAERFRGCFDFVIGGYPCQPFSQAGKRAGADDPRHLWPYIAEIVSAVQPVWCFFENVAGHLSLGFPAVYRSLRELGYQVEAGLFNASECGAPHKRLRLFVLVHRQRSESGAGTGQEPSTGERGDRPAIGSAEMADAEPDGLQGRIATGGQAADVRRRSAEPGKQDVPNAGGGQLSGRQSVSGNDGPQLKTPTGIHSLWPAPPGQSQYEWEEPRVVVDDARSAESDGVSSSQREAVSEIGQTGQDVHDAVQRRHEPEESEIQTGGNGAEFADQGQAEQRLGITTSRTSTTLDEAINESETYRAREVLRTVWNTTCAKEVQRSPGRPSDVLAEAVLLSRMRMGAFPQTVCYSVWSTLQSGKEAWQDMPVMQRKEEPQYPSHQSGCCRQFSEQLAHALCVLSYRLTLERGQASETPWGLHGEELLCAAHRAWVLYETLPEVQEVRRSLADQAEWEKRAYFEAADAGHSRVDELRSLGNGVVPAQAELAFRTLYQRLRRLP